MEWNDIREKEPIFNKEILVYTSKKNYKIDTAFVMGMFGAYNWKKRKKNELYLYWMPLPRPPKE